MDSSSFNIAQCQDHQVLAFDDGPSGPLQVFYGARVFERLMDHQCQCKFLIAPASSKGLRSPETLFFVLSVFSGVCCLCFPDIQLGW